MYSNRISTAARYNLLTADIQKNEANYMRLTQQLASGKKILSISDDPIAAVNIVNTNRQLGQIETFNQNTQMAMEELDTLDALMELAEGLYNESIELPTTDIIPTFESKFAIYVNRGDPKYKDLPCGELIYNASGLVKVKIGFRYDNINFI